jgi:hypothetical protein
MEDESHFEGQIILAPAGEINNRSSIGRYKKRYCMPAIDILFISVIGILNYV